MFKILMIENNPVRSAEIVSVLKEFCQLHVTSSTAIGLNLAIANKYDLIMIDLNLEEVGLDMAQLMTRDDNNTSIPIVAFSSGKLTMNPDSLFSHGFTDILSEPFNIRNFAQQIKFIISTRLKNNYFAHNIRYEKPSSPKLNY